MNRYRGERGDHYWVTVRRGDKTERVQKTRWSFASGSFRRFFDDVLVVAGRGLKAGVVDSLEPWPLARCREFDPRLIAGFVARTYDVGLAEGLGIAKTRIAGALRDDVRRRIGGDEQRIHSVETQYGALTYKHLLLPVWLLAYRYRERLYQVIVNAATGEVQGERPWSWVKITLAVLRRDRGRGRDLVRRVARWRAVRRAGTLCAALLLPAFACDGRSTPTAPTAPDRVRVVADADALVAALAARRGEPLLVNLWATWCPPCIDELPELVAARPALVAVGGELLGVSVDLSAPGRTLDQVVGEMPRFLDSHGVRYPVLIYGASDLGPLVRQFALADGEIPITVAFDRGGRIVAVHHGRATRRDLETLIERASGQ